MNNKPQTCTFDTNNFNLFLRTTENTYEVKTSKNKKSKYIPLSYDIVTKTTNEEEENNVTPVTYRLKIYVSFNEKDTLTLQEEDIFAKAKENALLQIKKAVRHNMLHTEQRIYLENTYYTLQKFVKGEQQTW